MTVELGTDGTVVRLPRARITDHEGKDMELHPRPVEDYLTLTDGQRVIELGAFLSPDERRALHAELTRALAKA